MNKLIYIFLLLGFFANGQFAQLRLVSERANDVDIIWETAAGASGYEIRWATYSDNVGFLNVRTDIVATKTLGSGLTEIPRAVITGTSASITNMITDQRHYLSIRAIGATDPLFNDWSYWLATRPGLYPIEETSFASSPSTRLAEMPQGDYSWRVNEFGVHEKKVNDRTRDGNTQTLSTQYPKLGKIYQFTDGTEIVSGYTTPTSKQFFHVETSLPYTNTPATNNDIGDYYSLIPTDIGILQSWDVQPGDDQILKRYDIDGTTTTTTVIDATGLGYVVKTGTSSMFRNLEERRDWKGQYIAAELYDPSDTSFLSAIAVTYNMTTGAKIGERNTGYDVDEGQIDISPYGDYVILNTSYNGGTGTDGNQIVRYDNDATLSNPLVLENVPTTGGSGHADNSVTSSGNQAIVARKAGKIVMTMIDGPKQGQVIDLFTVDGSNIDIGHGSARAIYNQGWFFFNVKDDEVGDVADARPKFDRKIFSVYLDESVEDRGVNTIVRFWGRAQHNGDPRGGAYATNSYFQPNMKGNLIAYTPYPAVGSETDHGETYIAKQMTLHGDEKAWTGIGNGTPATEQQRKNSSIIHF